MKKRNFILKILMFLVIMTIFTGMISLNTSANTTSESTGSLSVYGNGAVKVKPDIAILNIAVITRGKDTGVQKENNAVMEKVIAAVKKLGIDEKDIKTAGYYMNPEYNYSYDKDGNQTTKLKGYVVNNRIEVKVRDIEKAGDILSEAEKAGANEIAGISFTVSNPEIYYKEALEKAIIECKSKAEVMAKTAGITLGKPLSISEGGNYNNYYTNSNISYAASPVSVSPNSVSIESGEMTITASVSMIFSY